MSIPPEEIPSLVRPARPESAAAAVELRAPLPADLREIAIFRALALGDLLTAVPAFRALRSANPQARVTLIGLPWARSFVARFGAYLDDFLEFPGYPGIPERAVEPARLVDFLRDVQARRFDLAIQLQGNGLHSNAFVQLLGAQRTAGYFLPGESCLDPETYLPYPSHEPEVRRHIALMEWLGFAGQGEQLEFPLDEMDEADAAALRQAHGLAVDDYVCVHAGASIADRRWPPERFARVADCLAAGGLRVVLTGTEAERPLTAAVAAAMACPAVDAAGRTSLGGVAALLRDARLLVSNDTGVAHIAAALEVPSVVIFLASERQRWAARDGELHAAVGEGSGPACRDFAAGEHRCLRDACRASRPDGRLTDVPVEAVWAEVERRLERGPASRAGEGSVARVD